MKEMKRRMLTALMVLPLLVGVSETGNGSAALAAEKSPVISVMGGNAKKDKPEKKDKPGKKHTHNYVKQVIKEATCSEEGIYMEICSECGDSMTGVIEKLDHTVVFDAYVASTCRESGLTAGKHCASCGEVFEEQKVLDPLGHQYGEGMETAATCTEDGKIVYSCSVCGDSYEELLMAKGHVYGDGIVTKEPAVGEEGIMTYLCQVCGDERTESIPALEGEDPGNPVLKVPEILISRQLLVDTINREYYRMVGKVADYEHLEEYYKIIRHGFVYCPVSILGNEDLNLMTQGRNNVIAYNYREDGSYAYPFPQDGRYAGRAYLIYLDGDGNDITIYSDIVYNF